MVGIGLGVWVSRVWCLRGRVFDQHAGCSVVSSFMLCCQGKIRYNLIAELNLFCSQPKRCKVGGVRAQQLELSLVQSYGVLPSCFESEAIRYMHNTEFEQQDESYTAHAPVEIACG